MFNKNKLVKLSQTHKMEYYSTTIITDYTDTKRFM